MLEKTSPDDPTFTDAWQVSETGSAWLTFIGTMSRHSLCIHALLDDLYARHPTSMEVDNLPLVEEKRIPGGHCPLP